MTDVPVMRPRINPAFKLLMSVHWWMAGIYIPLFIIGTIMSKLERGAPFRNELFDFHKSLGVLSMALLPDLFPPDKAMVAVGRNLHFWLSDTFLAFLLHAISQ